LAYARKWVPAAPAGGSIAVRGWLSIRFASVRTPSGATIRGELPSLLGWLGAALTIFGVCWGLLVPAKK
ncbi:MAG TPA: hypothetical protein PKI49_07085, partial [Pseudomonadota bacterium]|nr:hypothetical protein [Pseudomonadota bacterium]